ncbi:hypothetical protein JCM14076_08500 [Methylosoma difficile]
MSKSRTLLASIASVLLSFYCALTGCVGQSTSECNLPVPPIRLPFAVQNKGAKIETELLIIEEKEYIFQLSFIFKENNELDRARLKKLVGETMQDQGGDPSIPISLRLKISSFSVNNESFVYDQELSKFWLISWGADSFEKRIVGVKLKPGHYRINVESLNDIPKLIGTSVFFTMAYSNRL